jgi:hypothetical protein
MQKVKVLSGQSLFDIAIQYTGDAINTYAIAQVNGRSLTDCLLLDEYLVIPDGLLQGVKELKYLNSLSIVPATGITDEINNELVPDLGIGLMAVGTTFIIA